MTKITCFMPDSAPKTFTTERDITDLRDLKIGSIIMYTADLIMSDTGYVYKNRYGPTGQICQ